MMRSLFAGVSGLKNHQTRMDVISNNIANVNTVGFKKSRVTFQDMLNQTLRGASSPQAGRGGTNPMQVGLGMTLASIDVIHTAGSPQSTGKNTDLSIEGEGFFIMGDGSNIYYSRAGNFDFDFNKTLINTSNGMVVKGILADSNGVIDPNASLSDLNLSSHMTSPPKATSTVQYSKNLDSTATVLTGELEDVAHTNGSDTEVVLNAEKLPVTKVTIAGLTEGTDFTVDYLNGKVTIDSSVATGDYDITYWMPNYQAPITVYDSKGDAHQLVAYFTKVNNNTWEVDTSLTTVDASGNTVVNFLEDGKGTLVFSPSTGKLNTGASSVSNATLTVAGADPFDILLNFANVTEYAGDFTIIGFSQDGYSSGDLKSVAVDTTGTITGSFSNGQNRKLAQIAIATFANPAGLMKVGNNLFLPSNNSGEPDQGLPGVSGRGIIKPETLEMSNVDLSQEFVDMIITQRGFQANSRVISASDQILEELVNLRR
ncbi:MAG: flagellar hook protein FlgE [Peptococcaceae bacterium]|jgi:flagellar hook protein FlgE|nr:flagellar hook protein FlgE [Peptococcaceae bacterium]MDH7524041.1 flagellar hook protein FlgE [Peptococcaceae bacterium]